LLHSPVFFPIISLEQGLMADSHREEIAKLETLYANNPEGRVFTHLAEAYRKAGELQRAREIVEDGLRRHAEYSSAHVVLGRVLMDLGETESARGAFERVLELDAHNLIALRSLGEIAVGGGRPAEALPYYRELVSLDPADDRLRITIGRLEEQAAAQSDTPADAVEDDALAAPMTDPGLDGDGGAPTEPVVEADPLVSAPDGAVETFAQMPEGTAGAEAREDEPAMDEQEPASLTWEDDVGVPLDALPGDLAALDTESLPVDEPDATQGDDGISDLDIPGWSMSAELAAAEGDDLDEDDPAADTDWVSASDWDRIARSADLATYGDEEGVEAAEDHHETTGTEPVADADGSAAEIDAGIVPWQDSTVEDEEPTPPDEGWTWPVESGDVEAAWAADPGGDSRRRESDDDEPFVSGAGVMTETMAELYTAQGFHARAAEVYRTLLQERPDDARLEARLREAEAAAKPTKPEGAPDATSEDEHERWLQGVESAWTGGDGSAMAAETPYAWAEHPAADETEGGVPISSYFRELLAWRPAVAQAQASEDTDVPVLDLGDETGGGPDEWDMPLLLEEEVVEEDPVAAPAPAVVEETGGMTGEPSSATNVEEAFDEWFGPRSGGEPAPEPAAEDARADDAPESDEDLEMFRSWLQSLKK
jgi:tetratricopeptide (TPR) repeat protein